jgi:hypothetical protein
MLITSALMVSSFVSCIRADEQLADIDEKATHLQSRTIDLAQGQSDSMTVNAFCLTLKGEILATVGDGPGEIRIFSDEGKLLRSWKMSVKP